MPRFLIPMLLLFGSLLHAQSPMMMPPPPATPSAPAQLLIVKNATLAQLRAVTAWLGAKTKYASATKTITITRQSSGKSLQTTRVVVLTVGATAASIDGKPVQLSSAPVVKNNLTYVPLRFVGEAFGATVTWNAKDQEALLSHPDVTTKLYLAVKPFDASEFYAAISAADATLVQHILERHPEMLNAKDPQSGASGLFEAAAIGSMPMVKLLLDAGAELTTTVEDASPDSPFNGATLLHAAAFGHSKEIMALLLDKGMKVDSATKGNITALHLACFSGPLEVVQLLVDRGANVNLRANIPPESLGQGNADIAKLDSFGTPLMLAGMGGQKEIQDYLLKHGAKALEPAVVDFCAKMVQQRTASTCISNLRQLAMASLMAAQDNGEKLPEAKTIWEHITKNFSKELCKCPGKPDQEIGYGFNAELGGKALADIKDPATILLFADGGNADHLITGPADIDTTRHGDGYCAAFLDGHVQFMKKDEAVKLK